MGVAENKAVVAEGYAAFGEGDLEGFLKMFASDAVWVNHGAGSPLSGEHKGINGVRTLLERAIQLVDVTGFALNELLADGSHVIALVDEGFTVKATGKHHQGPVVYVFEVRDGAVHRLDEFLGDLDPGIW